MVVVRWNLHSDIQQYHETLRFAADKLELHQVGTPLRKPLADLALRFSPVFIWRSDFTDDLSKYAHRMLSLIAAIKQLLNSYCYTETLTIQTARVIVFFLMTIYTWELCEVSRRLANELYYAIPKTPKDSMRYAIRVYLQIIDEMIKLQRPNSLLSDVFAQVQPRLEGLMELLRQLLVEGKGDTRFDVNDSLGSNLPQFDITIGLTSEMQEIIAPLGYTGGIRQNWLLYPISVLLRSDFNESMNLPTSYSQTIDPSLLSPEIDRKTTVVDAGASTTLYSSDNRAIFSSGIEHSQSTDVTYPHPDATGVLPSPLAAYLSSFDSATGPSAGADFLHIGGHFTN